MFSKLRPLIFKVDPEKAHTLAIKSLKFNLIPNVFDENKNDPIFQTKIFDKELDNPIGMAAGFDKNAEVYNSLFKLGFGFVEVGTITPLKQYGNPKPRVFRLIEDEALINRLGFNNHGAEIVKDRIKRNNKMGLLGINIGPNKDSKDRLNDYLIGLKTFYDDADYITINISSPNTENLRTFHEGNKLQDLLKSIMTEKKNLKSIDFMRERVRSKNLKYNFLRIDKEKSIEIFNNGGWHFNNIMTPEEISLKLKTFAHAEFSGERYSSIEVIEQKIKNREDLFDRGHKYEIVKLDKNLPKYILDNLESFNKFIL